ncbi:ester cyclase [Pseudonocardia endophytica]|uniref:Putative ester cyclase n=1 Tax=Pseudonocardia endophytica TaxID=401976 RepID=A0A4R1I1Q6_PSEEN|nr:ester cyclase [Pseudonocardia endophytica]TCK27505.1 putative ester cyclase [Pseudonocardia endophytica]
MDEERIYQRYLDTLNERRFDDLGQFVHDRLVYNDEDWTLGRYVGRLVDDVAVIPDLRYDAELVVTGPDRIAARLRFDCSPRGTFLGVETDGRRVAFAEHVFYRLHDGRIDRVWSLIDVEAVRRQSDS